MFTLYWNELGRLSNNYFSTQFIDITYHPWLANTLKEQMQFTWVCFVALTWIQSFKHTLLLEDNKLSFLGMFILQVLVLYCNWLFYIQWYLLSKKIKIKNKKRFEIIFLVLPLKPVGLKSLLPVPMSFLRSCVQLFQVWRSYCQ